MSYNVVYVFTSCKRSGPIQIMYNLISNLDRRIFEPILVTLYDEIQNESELNKFIDLGVSHIKIPTSKREIIIGNVSKLKSALSEMNPSIIHSMGVFPDYAVSKMKFDCQVITLHNYMHEDYLTKFGPIKGRMLENLQMLAVKRAKKVWTCSESLSKKYMKSKNMQLDYIRNGIDITRYKMIESDLDKIKLRELLGLPQNKTIFVYTGQFIDRKDQHFLIDLFNRDKSLSEYVLLLLGDGPNYLAEKERNKVNKSIVFTGNVPNVEEYLMASDYYISCSRSEGLPTSVLEALSCGLPVILSDILQHKEILEIDKRIGLSFILGDGEDCSKSIRLMVKRDKEQISILANNCVRNYLSANIMSNTYQKEYIKVIKSNELSRCKR